MEEQSQEHEELTDEQLRKEVEKIFVRQIAHKRFWACIFAGIPKVPVKHISSLRLRWDFKYQHGVVLEYNPEFIIRIYKQNPLLLEYYIAHEGSHLVLKHMGRWLRYRRENNLEKDTKAQHAFNIAADLAVNGFVLKTLFKDDTPYHQIEDFRSKYLGSEYFPQNFGWREGLPLEAYLKNLITPPRLSYYNPNPKAILTVDPTVTEVTEVMQTDSWSGRPTDRIAQIRVPPSNAKPTPMVEAADPEAEAPQTPHTRKTSVSGQHGWDLPEQSGHEDEESNFYDGDPDQQSNFLQSLEDRFGHYFVGATDSYAKRCGSAPGGVRQVVKDLRPKPTMINWKQALPQMAKSGRPADDDVCYGRWNRRLLHLRKKGILPLPGSLMMPGWRIVFIMDTSGSMSIADFAECQDVLMNLLRTDSSLELYVAQADTVIRTIYQVGNERDIRTEFLGRGGTNFTQPIAEVERTLEPDLIVYGTDGWGCAPVRKPKTPIIWALTPRHQIPAPYGRVIVMESGKNLR